MRNYGLGRDVEMLKELMGLSERDLARQLGVSTTSLFNWRKDETQISAANLEGFYDFAYRSGYRLNTIKEHLYREDFSKGNDVVLFHGAKTCIDGDLNLGKSRVENDFGRGFYCGESFEQSAMFVAGYPSSCVYIAKFDKATDLKCASFQVDRDWMLAIACFRKRIDEYSAHPLVQSIAARVACADYVVAPIADNRMYKIIDDFIGGEITDVQCQHCLSATNLGFQYVFVSQEALRHVQLLCRCYLADAEKRACLLGKREENKVGNDKAKVARREYRGQGLYIDQMLR